MTHYRVGLTCESQFEMAKSPEELQWELEEERTQSKQLMEEVELMRLQQELETEKLKQKQWHLTMEHLKETREHAEREHTKYLEELKQAAEGVKQNTSKSMLDWFKAQANMINKPGGPVEEIEPPEQERARLEKEAQEREIKDLQAQQLEITQKLERLTRVTQPSKGLNTEGASQELLLQQLKNTLTNKKEEDPNKALIRALVTAQNKTQGEGDTSTLKPALLSGILGGMGLVTPWQNGWQTSIGKKKVSQKFQNLQLWGIRTKGKSQVRTG